MLITIHFFAYAPTEEAVHLTLKEDTTIHSVIVPRQGVPRVVVHGVHRTKAVVRDPHLVHQDDLMTEVHRRVIEDQIGPNVHIIMWFASALQFAIVRLHREVPVNRNLRQNKNHQSTSQLIQTMTAINLSIFKIRLEHKSLPR
ncbi:hypothetical protein TELCIR_22902 [Teladorsagia circumcincta]|uniref:Uncharacterized protein n=1 Tax=Teladorsagia circumcincta TaxID=45464 RepID=A0A2G9TEC3_TELCI|nr:hypothetical protein TELCIR_22902 [Teladorsagia circumcincta]